MVTVSLCMIVKNEERILGRCLSCLCDLVDPESSPPGGRGPGPCPPQWTGKSRSAGPNSPGPPPIGT